MQQNYIKIFDHEKVIFFRWILYLLILDYLYLA